MLRSLLTVLVLSPAVAHPRRLGKTPSFDSSSARETPTNFSMVSRVYIPYNTSDQALAFGMGAAEQVAYDHVQKYAYAVSEQGVLNVIDWNDVANPQVLSNYAFDFNGAKLTDIEICSSQGVMFVGAGAADTVSNGQVHILSTVQRSSPAKPTSYGTLATGPLPDMILPNSDCTKLAVANEGEGEYESELVDPQGSVMIIEATDWTTPAAAVTKSVSLAGYTDSQLMDMGVHLPLPLDAMVYFDDHSKWKDDLNFSTARASYSSAMNLEPEYLSWSADDSTLFVNLQENNAVAIIDVPATGSPTLSTISGLGLKDHGSVPIDINADDNACVQATYTGLMALRHPDAIQAVEVDGKTYVITANEGDDKGYGDFEEKMKLKDVVNDDGTVDGDMVGMTVSASARSTAMAVSAVGDSLRITVGSTAINYTDPSAPGIQHIVAFGGRGVSIYEHGTSGLALTWDSGDQVEKEQCAHYPWAHNAIQDEEFAPVNGHLYMSAGSKLRETLDEMNDPSKDGCADGGNGQAGACPLGQMVDDRSAKDGPGVEAIVAGKACGSLLAVTATEKQGTAFVYDISNIASPTLLFVKHLSPASETKNPGVAYADGTLGEIDPEAMIFLEDAHSPSGKAGVMFAGAWSGTMSFWEFECPTATTTEAGATDTSGARGVGAMSMSLLLLAFSFARL